MATSPVNSTAFYADFGKLESLRSTAQKDPQAAVKTAAKQFEGIFMQMMLKTMRAASMGEGMGDSEETKFYQDMFDQQLSVQLASGKGMGLAEKLVQQLQRSGLTTGAGAAAPGTAGTGNTAIGSAAPQDAPAALPLPGTATATPMALPGASVPAAAGSSSTPPLRAPVINGLQPPTATVPRSQREDFIASIQPAAERIAQQLGVGADTIIAHAALETGWGQHLPAVAGNNFFGIKAGASWQGASTQVATTEVLAGQPQAVQAKFRSYESVSAGLDDYARVIGGNARYASALNQGADVAAYARGLQRGGYATDPDYADKLVATAAAVRQIVASPRLKNAAGVPTNIAGATA